MNDYQKIIILSFLIIAMTASSACINSSSSTSKEVTVSPMDVPAVETTDSVPKVETTDIVPKVETTDIVPKVETTDIVPEVETTDIVPEVETTDIVPAVEIVREEQGYTSFGDVNVSGILKNNLDAGVTAWVNVDLFDKDHGILGTGYEMVNLDPNGESKFEVVVFNSSEYITKFQTYQCYVDNVD